ncbi:MAG: flagellar filament capping protein FliD [Candidatus Sericytochromatia bacterium]
MSDLRLSGLSSGLDTSAVIEQLMSIERRPINLMAQNQAKAQKVLDRYRLLNTRLAALQTSAKALQGTSSNFAMSPFATRTATSSDATKLSATADGNAPTGTYSVTVNALAREQKTGGGAFGGTVSGQLTVTDSQGTATNVAITAGMTAADVALAVNGANGGMSATVIDNKLVLTGKQTGETYTLSDDVGGNLVTDLGLNLPHIQAAQSADVTIDGVNVISKSNTITTALAGVSLNLNATGATTLTIAQNNSAATDKVKDLVAKYNDIIKQIKEDTKYDAATKTSGVLQGNSFVNSLQTQLNRMFTEIVDPTAGAAYRNANDLGLTTQRDGSIALDEAKLNTALTNNAAAVFKVFGFEDNATHTSGTQTIKEINVGSGTTVGDGVATRLAGFVDSLIASASAYNEPGVNGLPGQGGLLARITSQQTTITSFDTRMDAYEKRLELRERSLRTQFLAMEKAVSLMKNQGNYLSSQLAGMQQ